MSSLPAELENLVCSFLSIADLKRARQINKRWAYISGPFLFEELWIAQPTLQKLEDVSCHETLRFYVKKIVLHILPVPVIPPAVWKEWTRLKFLHISPKERASKYQRYKFLYNEQQRFAGSDLAVATMRRAVDKLPHLLCLEGREMPPQAQRMKYFLPPLGSPGNSDDLAIYGCVQELISIRDLTDAMKFMSNTLTGLFQTRSGRKVKHFSPGTLSSWYITKPSQSMLGLALFEHLKALEVRIPFVYNVAEHMSGLQNTLSKTPCLEKLVLNIEPIRTRTHSDVLEGFRPSQPKLEHFEICGGHTTEASLTSLLTQFIGSLRSLRLDMISLIGQPLGQHSTSWSKMLSIFVSEDWDLARVTLKDLSYFHPDKWSKTWLTAQCLLSIQDAIPHKAALPENEAYDDENCAHRQSSAYYSGPIHPCVETVCWEGLE